MDIKEFITKLEASTAELTTKSIELTAAKASVVELTASNEALKAELAELKSKNSSITEVEAQLAQLKQDMTVAAEMLSPHVKAALIASGVAEGDVPTDLVKQVKLVEDRGLKLHQIITPGAKSEGVKVEDQTKSDPRKGSFKLSN